MQERTERLKKMFCEIYGGSPDDLRIFASPGRVNLIGEHIDYCGGFVLPAALTLDTVIVMRVRKDRKIRLAATDLPDRVELDLDNLEPARNLKWGNYQAGVADELQKAGYTLVGADMLYDDTVPHGAGLSSSAAIEVATAFALAKTGFEHGGIDKNPDPVEMALISRRAENNFCGVSCGIMDQFASAMGKKDHAILLNCSTLEYRYVPLRLGKYCIILADTKKKRSLADSKYNERFAEVSKGLRILRNHLPQINNLCDMTPEDLKNHIDKIEDPVIRRRVEHVVMENARVHKSIEALEKNDIGLFGEYMKEAHESIRDLYEVTGPELDAMFEEALAVPGVVGARMTGAGFGGCTVNIVERDAADEFISVVGKNYEKRTGLKPAFYICDIGDGVREIVLR